MKDSDLYGSEFKEYFEDQIREPNTVYDSKRDFVSLDAWKRSRDLKLFFYNEIIPKLPEEEKYALNNQIRRAAISITANIAEGYGRYSYQEGIQFYRIARGSIYELKDHLISCFDLKFIPKDLHDRGLELIEAAKVKLNGFIQFVKKQKKV